MKIADSYTWEAEKDGGIITTGGDLTDCTKFSLIPRRTGLPEHSLSNIIMKRRFGRGMVNAMGGGTREYLHCVVCEGFRFYVKSTTGEVFITPEDYELYL